MPHLCSFGTDQTTVFGVVQYAPLLGDRGYFNVGGNTLKAVDPGQTP